MSRPMLRNTWTATSLVSARSSHWNTPPAVMPIAVMGDSQVFTSPGVPSAVSQPNPRFATSAVTRKTPPAMRDT